jgi:hypothetical protein
MDIRTDDVDEDDDAAEHCSFTPFAIIADERCLAVQIPLAVDLVAHEYTNELGGDGGVNEEEEVLVVTV